jgi:hypothetical protein
VQSSVAASTVSAITDAAVTKISSQLNVAGTGFDTGTSDLVSQAVASGLQNIASSGATSSSTQKPIGGAYQNEILAGGGASVTPPEVTPKNTSVSQDPTVSAKVPSPYEDNGPTLSTKA